MTSPFPEECGALAVFWVVVAMAFAGFLYIHHGAEVASLFVTGYAGESAADNLFVMMAIFLVRRSGSLPPPCSTGDHWLPPSGHLCRHRYEPESGPVRFITPDGGHDLKSGDDDDEIEDYSHLAYCMANASSLSEAQSHAFLLNQKEVRRTKEPERMSPLAVVKGAV